MSFKDFPLSDYTLRGLREAGFEAATEVQQQSLSHSLQGADVLGAARTGSGKTLAFVIPILELLHREKWTNLDGLGALIITPTRELAYQIFEVLRKVGHYHDFSAGLVIGGKDLNFERKRIYKCNIIVCTPGRLLQHMHTTSDFNWDQLKILVLDEADRILDLGFAKDMNAIIENLPPERQTLLFSATQTKSVKDLARLSLKDPVYISVHEHEKTTTPEGLAQSYVVCELHEKLNMLFSFLKSHSKQKILVFMATCKQVKYTYELFCRLKPGVSLMALYGSLHQLRRMEIYDSFSRKQRGVLIATDIAARGLDFPEVNWVVQVDCPEDVNTYIHRAGRTARFTKDGEALLVVMPSEEQSLISQLREKKIPIEKIDINQRKLITIDRRAEAFCARDVALKESAQRAFKSYLKNIFLMKDKTVFKYDALDHTQYAHSLGLAIAPRVRFVERAKSKNSSGKKSVQMIEEDKNVGKSQEASLFGANDKDDEDELFTVKSTWRPDENDFDESIIEKQLEELKQSHNNSDKIITKVAMAKKLLKKKIKPNVKLVFNEEGEAVPAADGELPREQTSEKLKQLELRNVQGIDIELAKEIMKDEDQIDKQLFRKLIKEKHRAQKAKEKQKRRKEKKGESSSHPVLVNESDLDDDDERNEFIDALPDPDKYYNDNNGDKEEDSGGSDNESPHELGDDEEDSFEGDHDVGQEFDLEQGEEASSEEPEDESEDEREEREDESADEEAEDVRPVKRKADSEHEKIRNKLKKVTDINVNEQEDLVLHMLRSGK